MIIYKGRPDDRMGVVSLLVAKQGHPPVRHDCEVVDTLGEGVKFLIGTDLMPHAPVYPAGWRGLPMISLLGWTLAVQRCATKVLA
jgi:hypothetical protein